MQAACRLHTSVMQPAIRPSQAPALEACMRVRICLNFEVKLNADRFSAVIDDEN